MEQKKEIEINFCTAFVKKITDIQGIENQVRYLVDDFLFEEGWASKGNPKDGKDGYSHQYTYNYSNLRHFTEDIVRFIIREFRIEQQKNLIPRDKILAYFETRKDADGKLPKELEKLNKLLF
jgi:hypothetical protein